MNKEDMWVSRVPLPVRYRINDRVEDDFNNLELNGDISDWNIYAPVWAPVSVVKAPGSQGNCLQLMDQDPYDYARAIRVFEEGEKVEINLKVLPDQENQGRLEIEVTDQYGNRPVRIKLEENGKLVAMDGSEEKVLAPYQKNNWNELKIIIEANVNGKYDLHLNSKVVLQDASLAEAVKSVERLSLRTGPFRDLPNRKTPNEDPEPPLPGADEQVPQTLFYIDDVEIELVK
jgi:hypothetical protein